MRQDRMDGFTALIYAKDSLIDTGMTGLWPNTLLEERVRNILSKLELHQLDPKLIAEKIISTGVYCCPQTFSEFYKNKFETFKTLSNLHRKSVTGNNPQANFSLKLTEALSRSVGLLSKDEILFAKGGFFNNLGYINSEDIEDTFEHTTNSHRETIPRKVTLDEAIKLSKSYQNIDLIVADSFGVFDMLNEGQQHTLFKGKHALGSNSILMVGVVDESVSKIMKDKSPLKNLERRINNVLLTKGVDIVFPVTPPESVHTNEQLADYFNELHLQLATHARIIGNPKNVGSKSFQIYQEQCQSSTTLLLYNEEQLDVSSTLDREVLIHH